jgi:predicted small metal-binding protein
MAYTYRCRDFPGMEACPASFTAQSPEEVMKHVELHATQAHGEDPSKWSKDDRAMVDQMIRRLQA